MPGDVAMGEIAAAIGRVGVRRGWGKVRARGGVADARAMSMGRLARVAATGVMLCACVRFDGYGITYEYMSMYRDYPHLPS